MCPLSWVQFSSSWTVRKDAAALGKLFQKKTTDFGVTLPKRHRSDVTQHRGSTNASKFSEKRNRDLVDFCKATGLRRREVKSLRTSDVWKTSDGCVLVHVRAGKGGKERIVQSLNHCPLEIASAKSAVSGGGESAPLFDRVPIRTPIHMYRRDYAQKLYRSLARPMDSLSRCEVYRCQRDMSGIR
ncbi:MAG: tyrosine-type recombinase/integrase [Oscillospiraceae bacterium]|nr:tyrosine-type recombinase/integrase [Oscillospiraceae bacterium]